MGCPHIYYIRALQCLSHALAYNSSPKLARELNEENSEEILKEFILSKKAEVSEKEFYYSAGGATQCVIEEAYEEGTDPLNASICGIAEFEEFIGLEEMTGKK